MTDNNLPTPDPTNNLPAPIDEDFFLSGEDKLNLGDYLLKKNMGMERPAVRWFIAHLYNMVIAPANDKFSRQIKLSALKVFASVFFNTDPDPEQAKKSFKFEVEGIKNLHKVDKEGTLNKRKKI